MQIPAEQPIEILYRDKHLVAAYKPVGLLVHKTNIDKHETHFMLQELRDLIGQHVYPIHRLDKPTSGLILFGLSSESAAAIQQQMESNNASKEYLLVCRGYCPESGEIDHALKPIQDFRNKKHQAAKPAQSALTQYNRLATIEIDACIDKYPTSRYSLVQASILTGRRHQIRRHFKHISHPIIGCTNYGKSTHNKYFSEKLQAPGLLLHSYKICIKHPVSDKNMTLIAKPKEVFSRVLDLFNWSLPYSESPGKGNIEHTNLGI